jgi:hypothetical protein
MIKVPNIAAATPVKNKKSISRVFNFKPLCLRVLHYFSTFIFSQLFRLIKHVPYKTLRFAL